MEAVSANKPVCLEDSMKSNSLWSLLKDGLW